MSGAAFCFELASDLVSFGLDQPSNQRGRIENISFHLVSPSIPDKAKSRQSAVAQPRKALSCVGALSNLATIRHDELINVKPTDTRSPSTSDHDCPCGSLHG